MKKFASMFLAAVLMVMLIFPSATVFASSPSIEPDVDAGRLMESQDNFNWEQYINEISAEMSTYGFSVYGLDESIANAFAEGTANELIYVDENGVPWLITEEWQYIDEYGDAVIQRSYILLNTLRAMSSGSGTRTHRNSASRQIATIGGSNVTIWVQATFAYNSANDTVTVSNATGGQTITGAPAATRVSRTSMQNDSGGGWFFGGMPSWVERAHFAEITGFTAGGQTSRHWISLRVNSDGNTTVFGNDSGTGTRPLAPNPNW